MSSSMVNLPKYSKLKKNELINICDSIGLATTGTKKDLLSRINNYTTGASVSQEIDYNEISPFSNQTPNIENSEQNEPNDRLLLENQDREYEESLRLDREREYIKSIVEAAIAADVAFEASRINENNDYHLDNESLRNARLKFFNSL
uniref:SAP domain-containing protein n=1 Tax=viral metagenome TaxID=1070528 RepID=A0A6C0AG83_9ZZZZ